MTTKKFSSALGNIGENYVDEAVNYTAKKKGNAWLKWGAIAACFVFVFAFIFPLIQITQDKLPTEDMQIIEFNNSYYEVCDNKNILERYGIKRKITKTDAGEFITYLTKKNPGGKSEYIATTEKTDIVLYSYSIVSCEAVYVICDNDKYNAVLFCNYVLDNAENAPLEQFYKLYNINSGADISSISVVDNNANKKVVGTTLVDNNTISDFYMLSLNLQGYNFSDYHEMNYGQIKTEEELVQAYKKTANNKIALMIETVSGLRFYLEYDKLGGWVYCNGTQRYYQVTHECAEWFENHIK